ncbi:uncharacterized protein LOC114307439 [Camellia sinensis]|uniref:uncharacterized protein LOC114307439 n=1 Tax=Camellia sinensis TaxID=4442 RepID=UPI001035FE2B|nr:uncharacterized protein LOC114307439 [Camellia sinensis]
MAVVTTVSFSVFANGRKRASFIPTRGLRRIKGLKIKHSSPPLTHLFFAAKVEAEECLALKQTLESYCLASGQLINLDKSGIAFSSNTPAQTRLDTCSNLGISPTQQTSKYLGLPSSWGKSKSEAYNCLIDRAVQKMQGWKWRLLSQADRETLVKAVVQAIPSYAMSCFMLPKNSAIILTSTPVTFGGVATQRIEASTGRVGPNSLSPSLMGEDRWIPSSPNFKPVSLKPDGYQVQWVGDVINSTHAVWDRDKILGIVNHEDVSNISVIPIFSEGQADTLIWHYTNKGNYEVKSGYQVARQEMLEARSSVASSSVQPPKGFWKFIWSLNIPPKIRNFWWRVCYNRLATKENLFRRKCAPSPHCPVCQESVESIKHILFHCDWVRAVWFGCNLGLRIGSDLIASALQWTVSLMQSCSQALDRREMVSRVATVGWCIWNSRNNWVFQQCSVDPHRVSQQACAYCFSSSDGRAALAVILRDSHGTLIDGVTSIAYSSSAKQEKAHAIRLACMFLRALGFLNLQVESDSQEVITLCISEMAPPWDIAALLHDIQVVSSSSQVSFAWIPKQSNAVGHWVARAHLHGALPSNWVSIPPAALSALLLADVSL